MFLFIFLLGNTSSDWHFQSIFVRENKFRQRKMRVAPITHLFFFFHPFFFSISRFFFAFLFYIYFDSFFFSHWITWKLKFILVNLILGSFIQLCEPSTLNDGRSLCAFHIYPFHFIATMTELRWAQLSWASHHWMWNCGCWISQARRLVIFFLLSFYSLFLHS